MSRRRKRKQNEDISVFDDDGMVENTFSFNKPSVKARNKNQKVYIKTLRDNDFVVCSGPAGTGKTHLAIGIALLHLHQGLVSKIVVSRPVVEAGENLGFLPGDLNEKMDPYMAPIFDELGHYVTKSQIRLMMHMDILEICPLAYMRGRTFNDCFIICDECQNATESQVKMLFTRMGVGSKMVVTGDTAQSDLPERHRGGLARLEERFDSPMLRDEGVATFKFGREDIVRNKKMEIMLNAWGTD